MRANPLIPTTTIDDNKKELTAIRAAIISLMDLEEAQSYTGAIHRWQEVTSVMIEKLINRRKEVKEIIKRLETSK